ncbi:DUF4232 domain-containing protein [Oryzihumus sp.]|jgi:hypothetical protein|uniref:DUF4232 domain-containing protein n=1 Tax=Oryzihumus sp. TaxID=1968903 RepID=UPI002ED8E4E6
MSALRLEPGPLVSPMTGEHALVFAVTNVGAVACSILGYPTVTLLDSKGATLPFRYTASRSPYVTHARPAPVLLRPMAHAYFEIAKYRCDAGVVSDAASVQVRLVAGTAALSGPTGDGVGSLSYCLGGPADPGQVVDVSPVEATAAAVLPS